MEKIVISVDGDEVKLEPKQGDFIKALIFKYCNCTNTEYANRLGFSKALLSRYLSGDNRLTRAALDKILSLISYERQGRKLQYIAKWRTIIEIQAVEIGPSVPNVDSTAQEEMLLSEDNG